MRIFISYSRIDELFARKLATALSQANEDIWLDVDDIPAGMNWSSAIQQGLDQCDLMLVIISPASMASRNVAEEWQWYLDNHKPVIPVLWKQSQKHFQLNRLQYVAFEDVPFDDAFNRLKNEIGRITGLPKLTDSVSSDSEVEVGDIISSQGERDDKVVIHPPPPLYRRPVFIGGVLVLVIALFAIVVLPLISPTVTPTLTPTDTLTPTPTLTPHTMLTPIPLGFPGNPVLHNSDWKPIYQTFDGVEMALVPVGCFMMGSENGSDEEKPHEQCFDKPFWIDRYEVTNKQYGSEGRFAGDSRPRDTVTWFDAHDFCASRGAYVHLPTEREWEYAARGPSNYFYPWGNLFVTENIIFNRTGDQGTTKVGTYREGRSWIGAFDLSGNLWEWIRSIYKPYPYVIDDGRDEIKLDVSRVIRGGSWLSNYGSNLRADFRNSYDQSKSLDTIGFRCARDY